MTDTKNVDKKKEVLSIAINKVQLTDAGIKDKYGSLSECCSPISKSGKDKVSYPSLYLSTKEAPDLK